MHVFRSRGCLQVVLQAPALVKDALTEFAPGCGGQVLAEQSRRQGPVAPSSQASALPAGVATPGTQRSKVVDLTEDGSGINVSGAKRKRDGGQLQDVTNH